MIHSPFFWLAWLLSFSMLSAMLMSCAPGPQVTVCTPRPTTKDFKCFNEANKKDSVLTPPKVDNWIFVSAADDLSIQKACMNRTGWPKVTACSFSALEMEYICFNEITGQSLMLKFENSGGWIGVSPVDEQILLDYCANLQP